MSTVPAKASLAKRPITIVGPGAIGAVLAGAVAADGGDVSLLGRRGAHLEAIVERGLELRSAQTGTRLRYPIRATDDAAELSMPELVVICVKSQDLLSAVRSIERWIDGGAEILVVANGVPWWLPSTTEVLRGDPILRSVDPDGQLSRALPAARVMAGVAHFSSAVEGPGRVVHVSGNRLLVGEPVGGVSERVTRCVAALSGGPIAATVSADIRHDVWEKLLGNVNLNPVSALTGATVEDIAGDPLVRRICATMFEEATAIGVRLGLETAMTAGERLDIALQLGAFRTSMLQDAERGRPLELDAIIGAARELAQRTGVPSPVLDTVHGLLALREKAQRHRLNASATGENVELNTVGAHSPSESTL